MGTASETKVKKLTDDVGYAKAEAKLLELKLERQRRQCEFGRIEAAIADRGETTAIDRRARRLLGEEVASAEDRETLETAAFDIRVLDRGIELATKALERERARASKQVAQERLPAYRGIVRRMGSALSELRSAMVDEANFRDQLFQDDVSYLETIRPMGLPPTIRDASDTQWIDDWHAEAREHFGAIV